MKDVNDEKTKLMEVLEPMEKTLQERDQEIQRLNTQASLNNWQYQLYANIYGVLCRSPHRITYFTRPTCLDDKVCG